MKLGKELVTATIAILVLTVVLGVAYPLVMTGISQVAFPSKADGSQIKVGGKVVGSRLIGQGVRDRHRQEGLRRQPDHPS